MIVKSFEIEKKLNKNINYYLLYGQNTGLINEILEKNFKSSFSKNVHQYDEQEIIGNNEQLIENIFNKSLFEKDKLIIVNQASDKILNLIENIIEKKTDSIKIILKSSILDKKSKLRKFFEKSDRAIIIPFYNDDEKTLSLIVNEFFKKKNIKISNQIVNLIIRKVNYNRAALNLELEKISNYGITNQNINYDDVQKLINLSEDYDISEIVNQSLAKNKKNTINMLNESDLGSEKSIIFLRSFLSNLKRLKNLKASLEKENNLDKILAIYKPPIFWRDKQVIKKQLSAWSLKEIKSLLKETNKLELKIKKNSQVGKHIMNNFILEKLDIINNKI